MLCYRQNGQKENLYLMWRMSVCESAKELNKLTCVWPCLLTEEEISNLEKAKRLLLNIIVRREEERNP